MSVEFTTITDRFIALCADKQETNMRTGEKNISAATKVEKWSPEIAVGWCGNSDLANIILTAVKGYVGENGLDNFTLEELADWFAQTYYAARDEYQDMPANIVAKFVVAGRMPNGNFAAIQIIDGNDVADVEIFEARPTPITLIFEPEDLSSEVCNNLFSKAITNSKNKNTHGQSMLEAVHRKAVRYVSEYSKYVGHKSDYIIIE